MKNRKGVTLLELILALALISIIIIIGTNVFIIGNKAQRASVSEADVQANTRLDSYNTSFQLSVLRSPRSGYKLYRYHKGRTCGH